MQCFQLHLRDAMTAHHCASPSQVSWDQCTCIVLSDSNQQLCLEQSLVSSGVMQEHFQLTPKTQHWVQFLSPIIMQSCSREDLKSNLGYKMAANTDIFFFSRIHKILLLTAIIKKIIIRHNIYPNVAFHHKVLKLYPVYTGCASLLKFHQGKLAHPDEFVSHSQVFIRSAVIFRDRPSWLLIIQIHMKSPPRDKSVECYD